MARDPRSNTGGQLGMTMIGGLGRTRAGRVPPRNRRGMSLEQWANAQASKIINARVQAIQQAKQMYLDEINRDADEQRSKYDAMARGLREMNFPGQIQGIYGGAAGNIGGLAGAMSQAGANVVNAQAATNQNMVSGTGQEGSLAGVGGLLGEVMNYSEGVLPANTYGDIGKAFAAQAALQPGFGLQIGYGDVETTRREALKGLQDFMLQIAEARSERPELAMEFRTARQKEQFERQQWEADQHYRKYLVYQEQGKTALANKELALATRKQKAAEREANRQYTLDTRRENRLQGEADKPSASSRLTASQRQDAVDKILGLPTDEGFMTALEAEFENTPRMPGPPSGRLSVIEARMFAKYAALAPTPTAKKALRRAIKEAVRARSRQARGASGSAASSAGSGSSYDDFIGG